MNKEDIEKVLEEQVRPMLAQHGGSVELVEVDETTGIVKVRLTGHCAMCVHATETLKMLVEQALRASIPKIKEVQAV